MGRSLVASVSLVSGHAFRHATAAPPINCLVFASAVEAAGRSLPSPPSGSDCGALTVSLKRYPDTNLRCKQFVTTKLPKIRRASVSPMENSLRPAFRLGCFLHLSNFGPTRFLRERNSPASRRGENSLGAMCNCHAQVCACTSGELFQN